MDAAATIAAALHLERPLVVLDLESTGPNPALDRIVELGVTRIDPGGTCVTWSTLLNPGVPIRPSATAIHGITDEAVAGAPRFGDYAKSLAARLESCDLAGYNLRRFDVPLLAAEFKRCRVPWDPTKSKVVDAYRIFATQEPRDLKAAQRFYLGEEATESHRATPDVSATMRVLAAQLERYGEIPKSVDGLDEFCVGRQPEWIDAEGRFVWQDGCARMSFGPQAGRPMSQVPPGYYRWMVKRDFSESTKSFARAALQGRFPQDQAGTLPELPAKPSAPASPEEEAAATSHAGQDSEVKDDGITARA